MQIRLLGRFCLAASVSAGRGLGDRRGQIWRAAFRDRASRIRLWTGSGAGTQSTFGGLRRLMQGD
jgi:hypothetical protein